MRPVKNKMPPKKTPLKVKPSSAQKDPVEVYCRLRPVEDNEVSCISIISETTLQISPPETCQLYRNGIAKGTQYTFKRVFEEKSTQKEVFTVVSKPLVDDLLHGRNGLLFTYGVSGSGKTYTMTGIPQDGGILPRSLDVIFNSIGNFQARKYVFKPDHLNGFETQSEADAMLDRQNEILPSSKPKTPKTPRRRDNDSDTSERVPDSSRVSTIEEDNVYAVFVTYIEIYNNFVYDLLEETPLEPFKPKQLQSKILREDANHNMYVHGVTEVEVKTTEEAFEVFGRGQKRRRVAHTTLNTESSRSHSVFTVRLVQAPLDISGEEVMQDKRAICVSQLSLVDLAGSERTNRTNNRGDRLREAGNINNSLMTLRTCLEILRENQQQGTNKMVPYRDSKLTHLFKNYFDGEGKVRMIVCVNPRSDDYEETLHVMRFAEMTQEVQVCRPMGFTADTGMMPGRRRANMIYREAVRRMEEAGVPAAELPIDISPLYSLGPPFPFMEMSHPQEEALIRDLILYLETRINRRVMLVQDFQAKQNDFRKQLMEVDRELTLLRSENSVLKSQNNQYKLKISMLENRVVSGDVAAQGKTRQLSEYEMKLKLLEQENQEKEMLLNQCEVDKERDKAKLKTRLEKEKLRLSQELQSKLKERQAQLKNKMWVKNEKLRRIHQIITDDTALVLGTPNSTSTPRTPLSAANSELNLYTPQQPITSAQVVSAPQTGLTVQSKRGVAVVNRRHRRSRSAGGVQWLEHRPANPVELGTVFQPQMKKRRSVTKLTDVKDVTKAEHYCLLTQQQDSEGELETRLFKGDILPTSGGGAQVILNDMETLRQDSPTTSPTRKRTSSASNVRMITQDITTEGRCAVSVEGHSRASSSSKKPKV